MVFYIDTVIAGNTVFQGSNRIIADFRLNFFCKFFLLHVPAFSLEAGQITGLKGLQLLHIEWKNILRQPAIRLFQGISGYISDFHQPFPLNLIPAGFQEFHAPCSCRSAADTLGINPAVHLTAV